MIRKKKQEPPARIDSNGEAAEGDRAQAAFSSQLPNRTPLIAGNWKMNHDHLQAIATVQKLSWSLADAGHDYGQVQVAVFPPFTDLRSVQTLIGADKMDILLGAQDVSAHDSGAYTGEISGAFLSKLDVSYVLVGHSERRIHHQESDEIVSQKTLAAIRHGLTPIICVGETAEDLEGRGAAAVPVEQLSAVLEALPEQADYVIAYEPVWAIGSGQSATPEQAASVAQQLRETIEQARGEAEAQRTRILYGGSVSSQNVASFMRQEDIDGVLVGGASLNSDEFSKIVQYQKHVVA